MAPRPGPAVRLRPMTDREFRDAVARGIARHAEDRVRRGWWSPRGAPRESRRDFARLMPQGRRTPHRHFCKVVDARSGRIVGDTWYIAERKGGRPQFWVEWLWIEPAHRRRGYARATLRLLAQEAARRGAVRLALHVLADNRPALALYRQLGYVVTAHYMAAPTAATRSTRPTAGRPGSRGRGRPPSPRAGRASRSRS